MKMTIKIFLNNLSNELKDIGGYFRAAFTGRSFLISLGLLVGGMIGWSFFKIIQIAAFSVWGPITLPYTNHPLGLIALIIVGSTIGLLVSESLAIHKWQKGKKATIDIPTSASSKELTFNANNGVLYFTGKELQIPLKTNQYFVCKHLFKNKGERIDEITILHDIDSLYEVKNSERLIYDTIRAINKKAENGLGIKDLLCWESLTAWVNDEIILCE